MAGDISSAIAQLVQDAGQPLQKWSDLDARHKRLEAEVAKDEQLGKLLRDSWGEMIEKRNALFHEALRRLRDQINTGAIDDQATFNRNRLALSALGEHNDRLNREVASLQSDWNLRLEINQLRSQVERATNAYTAAISDGTDFQVAADKHLEPLKTRIEEIRQERGDVREIEDLLSEVRLIIKRADKGATITLASLGNFERILTNLNNAPDDYVEILVDENGEIHGSKPKDIAIHWYDERATGYAEKKADKYLEEVEAALHHGRIYEADSRLRDAKNLFRLPHEKKQEVTEYQAAYVAPLMKRIELARTNLAAIPTTMNVDTAIDLYQKALDPELGWSAFAILENSVEGNAIGRNNQLVVNAMEYIYSVLRKEIKSRLDQIDPTALKIITNVMSLQDMCKLEYYIHWGDGRLLDELGSDYNKLRQAYNKQTNLRTEVNSATAQALTFLNAKDYVSAFNTLAPYENAISSNSDLFPDAEKLWRRVNALQNIRLIKLNVINALDQGFDATKPNSELLRLDAILQDAISAIDANKEGADSVGLSQDVVELRQLVALVHGFQLREELKLDQALHIWRENIPIGSRFTAQANDYARDTETHMKIDRDLNAALRLAHAALASQLPNEAYTLLKPHEAKIDSRNYSEFVELFDKIRTAYGAVLSEEIRKNIDRTLDNPAELEQLAEQLNEVSPASFQKQEAQINNALVEQRARYNYQLADGTRVVKYWYNALESWQELYSIEPQTNITPIWEGYVDAVVSEALARSAANTLTIDTARAPLDSDALPAIQELAINVPQSKRIAPLRAQVYMRFVQLGDNLLHTRRYLQSVRVAIAEASDKNIVDIKRLEGQIGEADSLLVKAERLDTALKLERPLLDWVSAVEDWQSQQNRLRSFVGLGIWFEARKAEALAQLDQELAGTGDEIVRSLELLAKHSLLGDPIGDPRVLFEQMRGHVRFALTDMNALTEEDCTALEQASWALAFLINPNTLLMQVVETEGFDLNARTIYDPENYAVQMANVLKQKAQSIGDFERIVASATSLLDNAGITGDFDAVNDALAPIRNGNLIEYLKHNTIRNIEAELSVTQERYDRLNGINLEVKQHFKLEKFDLLLPLLEDLEKQPAGDDGLRPAQRVRLKDSFAADDPLAGTEQIRVRVQEKQAQIAVLETWLSPIITLADLLAQLRGTNDELSQPSQIDFTYVRVADFVQLDDRIGELRSRGQYKAAVMLLEQIDYGVNGTVDEPSHYERSIYSLTQALNHLHAVPIKEKRTSATAEAMYQWSALLFRTVRTMLEKVIERYDDLDAAQTGYIEQRDKLLQAIQGIHTTNGRERARFFVELETAYSYLVTGLDANGEPLPKRETPNYHYPLYPLAHQHEDILQRYKDAQRYR